MIHLIAALFVASVMFLAPPKSFAADFDYYVLALSWSPAFCESADGKNNVDQCGVREPPQTILHGLWPSRKDGRKVANCQSSVRLHDRTIRDVEDVTPSRWLIRHEWRKHGTCSGLAPKRYFELAETWYRRLKLPRSIKGVKHSFKITPRALTDKLLAANDWLSREAVSIRCKSGKLSEIQLCLNKQGGAISCPGRRRSCRSNRPLVLLAPKNR